MFLNKTIDIVKKAKNTWEILPKRWIVERTFAWFTHRRRLSKDYEISVWSAEDIVRLGFISVLLNRIT